MSPESKKNVMQQLMVDEGVVYEVYLDHLGLPTVGIGHLILESDQEHGKEVGTEISVERCEELFMRDLDIAISECVVLYGNDWEGFPEEVKEVLVNLLFNCGRPRLAQFVKMNAALAEGDWKTAAVEGRDSRWYNQVGNRAERLMSRLEAL